MMSDDENFDPRRYNLYVKRSKCVFVVKEGTDGKPFILIEPLHDGLAVLGEGQLGLEFRAGLDYTFQQASDIAEWLDEKFDEVTFAGPEGWADLVALDTSGKKN